ncbi:hypothetical protein ILYODFUR_029289 [Ilyodon furcidens]|uniref:Uncharacterized protein n=1 Tax=Ilyodon furcidens TaxID=33524 RepID=A0ABV0SQ45_9TELE
MVFYLWRAKKRSRRQRPWVHQILQGREHFGEYHHLLQELRLDDGRFQRYFCLSRTQFEDLQSCVGRRIGLRDTNYRRSIPAAERLSICLRWEAWPHDTQSSMGTGRAGRPWQWTPWIYLIYA